MASAPPLDTAGPVGHPQPPVGHPQPPHPHPQPPSYEEATGPQYTQGPGPQYTQGPGLPPAYAKNAYQPYQPYPPPMHSQAYPPPPAHSPINPIVSVQTIYVQPGVVYGDVPVHTHCPACAQSVVTRLELISGTMAWLTCAGLFIFGCVYGCCLLPFCLDGLKDVTHRCPNCSSVLGVYKRL